MAIQNILTTAYKYSTNWRFKFNADKSSVLRFSSSSIRNQSNLSWLLGNESVELSESYNHLGILLQSKLVHTEKIENGCRKGRQAYFGIKIRDHLNPDTLSRLYKKVVLPSILYGCELWCDLRQRDLQALGTLQHFICKNAMGLPKTTRSDICESLFGLLPISSEIDKRKLLFFGRLCDLDTKTLTKQIYFYIDCFPTYNRPNANNLALFTTSLLSCLSTISFNTSQFIFKLAIFPRNFYGKNP